ncbi:MAG: hypothetical protein QUV05_23120 [Phycisphaerae bacterium]|nr:hypothetical protein [Phycisphaerae bacterium]
MHLPRAISIGMGQVITATMTAMLLAGCSSSTERSPTSVGRSGGAAGRRIVGADVATVQPVAERIFRQHFRIDSPASGPGLIVAQPQEMTATAQPERVQDLLAGVRGRHRYLAELRLNQQGPDVLLRCVVQTQRLETSERAAFSSQRGDDRPTDTPIDRLGAASSDNREEWVSGKRDRELEQEILSAIEEACRPATSPTE